MPERIEYEPDGIDYGWVMQMTFVVTVTLGAVVVAVLSVFVADLDSWEARALFAVRVGAVIWIATAVAFYLYARWRYEPDAEDETAVADSDPDSGSGSDSAPDSGPGPDSAPDSGYGRDSGACARSESRD